MSRNQDPSKYTIHTRSADCWHSFRKISQCPEIRSVSVFPFLYSNIEMTLLSSRCSSFSVLVSARFNVLFFWKFMVSCFELLSPTFHFLPLSIAILLFSEIIFETREQVHSGGITVYVMRKGESLSHVIWRRNIYSIPMQTQGCQDIPPIQSGNFKIHPCRTL